MPPNAATPEPSSSKAPSDKSLNAHAKTSVPLYMYYAKVTRVKNLREEKMQMMKNNPGKKIQFPSIFTI